MKVAIIIIGLISVLYGKDMPEPSKFKGDVINVKQSDFLLPSPPLNLYKISFECMGKKFVSKASTSVLFSSGDNAKLSMPSNYGDGIVAAFCDKEAYSFDIGLGSGFSYSDKNMKISIVRILGKKNRR